MRKSKRIGENRKTVRQFIKKVESSYLRRCAQKIAHYIQIHTSYSCGERKWNVHSMLFSILRKPKKETHTHTLFNSYY